MTKQTTRFISAHPHEAVSVNMVWNIPYNQRIGIPENKVYKTVKFEPLLQFPISTDPFPETKGGNMFNIEQTAPGFFETADEELIEAMKHDNGFGETPDSNRFWVEPAPEDVSAKNIERIDAEIERLTSLKGTIKQEDSKPKPKAK